MERIRSQTARALGGAGRAWGGGLLTATCAASLLLGVGCTGPRAWQVSDVLPHSWVAVKPATQITPAFNPVIQHLPDPANDGALRPGLAGQMFLLADDGSFAPANGDLVVMAEDITPRPVGMPPAIPEVWHFGADTLRKLKTKDERFGDCYALFLPYPPNWKDVTQIRVSTQYKPKGDPTEEPVLYGPPQTVMLDFTPPGSQPAVWMETAGAKPTAPVEMKAIPNVTRDIASGGYGAPLTGHQSPQLPTTPPGTVTAGGTQPQTGGMMPMPPPVSPFNPPANMPPAVANTPLLPPPTEFTPDRPQTVSRLPNGQTVTTTAYTLPPGQDVPVGWRKEPNGAIVPINTPTAMGVPTTQTMPPIGYQPASAQFRPASEQFPSYSPPVQPQPRIQHGAFDQPQPQSQQPFAVPPATPQVPSLPPIPATAMPANSTRWTPPSSSQEWTNPTLPPVGGSNVAPVPPTFDPNSPVGAWATQPNPTAMPPLPADPNAPLQPVVIPRSSR